MLNDLIDMFHAVGPDNDVIENDQTLKARVQYVQYVIDEPHIPIIKKIEVLVVYNGEWFPQLTESEKAIYGQQLLRAKHMMSND